jgi:hypothetical protein
MGYHQCLALFGQVTQDFTGLSVGDLSSRGDLHVTVLTGSTGAVIAGSILASLGSVNAVIPKVDQSVEVGAGHQVDAPAITAIAAVRPAERDVFFAPETYAAITAVPGFDSDFRFINKFHGCPDKKAPSVTRLFVREKGGRLFLGFSLQKPG